MLRICRSRLAIGAYSLFMMEQKNNPALKGLPIAQRGRVTSKLYKALPPAERTALEKRAKAMPSTTRKKEPKAKVKNGEKKKRAPSEYANFVKTNLSKFNQLPHRERLAAVAKLWKQQQQVKNPPQGQVPVKPKPSIPSNVKPVKSVVKNI